MPNWAQSERRALCDLFVEVGPDAPTLAGAWTTRDLAAHLIVRESRPDAAAGIVFPPFADYSEQVRRSVAARPWPDLIEEVRTGPPVWSPMRLEAVDRFTNTVEFFVHHEDVRRARPDWQPRALEVGLERELWGMLRRMGRLLVRQAPCGVAVARAGGETVTLKQKQPVATLHGPVGELVLFCYGRQAHARVDITAPAALADALRTAKLGL
jgi:uncharacterized protein (TIGR03085 family)